MARFFSSPLNDASAVYWAKMTNWSIEEGVSLLLGKNPKKVSSEIMRERLDQYSVENSPFVKLYLGILDLATRLFDPVIRTMIEKCGLNLFKQRTLVPGNI
jgi:hypothetical protein